MFSEDFLRKSKLNNAALVLRHVGMWIASSPKVYQNPRFTAPESNPELSKGVAIYCVHGTADKSSSFSLIANRILSSLPSLISSVHLVAFGRRVLGESVENFAEQLKKQILANGDKHVILMGHSRGGLVVAYMAEYLAKEAGIQVEAVVGISSPFEGSPLVTWPLTEFSSSVKEMKVESSFLKALSEKIDHSAAKYFYFASDNDPIVPVHSSFRGQHRYRSMIDDKGGQVNIVPPMEPGMCDDSRPALVKLDFHDHLSIMSSHRLVHYLQGFIDDVVNRLLPGHKKLEEMGVIGASDISPRMTDNSIVPFRS